MASVLAMPGIDNDRRRASAHGNKGLPRQSPPVRVGVVTVVLTGLAVGTALVARQTHPPESGQVTAAAVGGLAPSAAPSGAASPTATVKATAAAHPPAPAAAHSTAPPAAFTAAVQAVVSAAPGRGAVAVTDLTTGASASFSDDGHQFDTGSIVKLDILSTMLYQDQQKGTTMSSAEQAEAVKMIENSDNDSANDLFFAEGGVAAITAANKVFGLTGTTVEYHWGTTTTNPTEQMKLLKLIFTANPVLTTASRSYIQGLMSKVESDQQWGVSAAASPGTGFMLKNGWLPDADSGLWTVNSVGQVTYDGHLLLIAVQTDGSKDMPTGVTYAQDIAAAAAKSFVAGE